jgi:hypothetical protein
MPTIKEKLIEERLGLKLRKNELINSVLSYVKTEGLTYSEAIIEVCEENEIEPEDIAKLITGPLKEKLRVEATNRNIISGIPKTQPNSIIDDCT